MDALRTADHGCCGFPRPSPRPRTQQLRHTARGGPVHRVDDQLEVHRPQPRHQRLQVQLFSQSCQVFATPIEAGGVPLDRHSDAPSGQPSFHRCGEVPFHGPAEGALDFQSEFGGLWLAVITRAPRALRSTTAQLQAGVGTGIPSAGAPARSHARRRSPRPVPVRGSAGRSRSPRCGCPARGAMGQFPGCCCHRQPALHGDVNAENTAPAIGAELNRCGFEGRGPRTWMTLQCIRFSRRSP